MSWWQGTKAPSNRRRKREPFSPYHVWHQQPSTSSCAELLARCKQPALFLSGCPWRPHAFTHVMGCDAHAGERHRYACASVMPRSAEGSWQLLSSSRCAWFGQQEHCWTGCSASSSASRGSCPGSQVKGAHHALRRAEATHSVCIGSFGA